MVGCLLIFVSAWVPVPLFYIAGLVLPSTVLVGYAYLGLKNTKSTSNHAQFADTIYYLGFIFTLVTLALALVYLASEGDWDAVPLDQLIGRFGVALATMILGLAIRVAAVNLTSPLGDIRDEAEQSLVAAISN